MGPKIRTHPLQRSSVRSRAFLYALKHAFLVGFLSSGSNFCRCFFSLFGRFPGKPAACRGQETISCLFDSHSRFPSQDSWTLSALPSPSACSSPTASHLLSPFPPPRGESLWPHPQGESLGPHPPSTTACHFGHRCVAGPPTPHTIHCDILPLWAPQGASNWYVGCWPTKTPTCQCGNVPAH